MGDVGSAAPAARRPNARWVPIGSLGPVTTGRRPRLQPAWTAAAVALVGAAGFRATPRVLIEPPHHEFGRSTATISVAGSVNGRVRVAPSPVVA